ncbi:MAG: alpha-L-fucosidase [Gemmatimonadaceae bacterium]|nr:alpha-L-fucosidase [Gemmatimonadaceae bacterium]
MTIDRRTLVAGAAGAALTALTPRAAEGRAPRGASGGEGAAAQAGRPRPSPSQLQWQRDELAMFLHFGVNTFSDREWGDGKEDPRSFAPSALDPRQWARVARETGFRMMILTAKHHDGFCLWPTATTRHSVASSPWKDGQGDVVREFVEACRAEGLRAGLYLSPWDRNHPTYGDTSRYNAVYWAQLRELLTQYGRIDEVWFDGANGEGPNGRRQEYDWARTWGLVRELQPQAVMFSDAGPDVRWIGNESGVAGTTNWSTVDPRIVTRPGMEGAEVMRSLTSGDRDGTVWRPGETDVSIRPGWFYHPAEDAKVRTPENLVELYFSSVGRNSKLLLNVPPDRRGLLSDADVAALRGMRARLDALMARDLAAGSAARVRMRPAPGAARAAMTIEYELPAPATLGVLELSEDIAQGQRVASHRVEAEVGGAWRELARGTTIGYKRLLRVAPVRTQRVRVTCEDWTELPGFIGLRGFAG